MKAICFHISVIRLLTLYWLLVMTKKDVIGSDPNPFKKPVTLWTGQPIIVHHLITIALCIVLVRNTLFCILSVDVGKRKSDESSHEYTKVCSFQVLVCKIKWDMKQIKKEKFIVLNKNTFFSSLLYSHKNSTLFKKDYMYYRLLFVADHTFLFVWIPSSVFPKRPRKFRFQCYFLRCDYHFFLTKISSKSSY